MSEHRVLVEKDYGKSFRSRGGSADWIVSCSCGWRYSRHAYGRVHAKEIAERHLSKNREKT